MFKSIGIIFTFLFTICESGLGQVHVQTTTLFQVSNATTIVKSFGAASITGDLIVVHLDWDNQTRSISTLTDSKGNTYQKILGPTNWNGLNYRAELWYAYNITGGGAAITITAKLTGAPTSFFQIYITEYTGIVTYDPLDQKSVAIGNTAVVSSGAKTTLHYNELIYGASIGASGVLTTGATFTNRSSANSNIIEDKNVVLPSANSAIFTSASGNWIAQMATFITTNTILPTELLSFTGHCNNNNIDLEWSTAIETNNDFFTIERSENGTGWSVIGTVKSVGNSWSVQKYSFSAEQTNSEFSYFRLKQTDIDGKYSYFNIIQVKNGSQDIFKVNIYPNPSNGRSLFGKVSFKGNEKYSIEIYNNAGMLISHFNSVQSEFTLNFTQMLNPGVYYAKISSATHSIATSFLVNR